MKLPKFPEIKYKKHGMPYSYGTILIFLGVCTFIMSNFIISVSHDNYLWWQVIKSVDQSPLILVLAYMMIFPEFAFIGVGAFIIITKDRTIEQD